MMTLRLLLAYALAPLVITSQVLLYLLFPVGYPAFWQFVLLTTVLLGLAFVAGFLVFGFFYSLGSEIYQSFGWKEADEAERQRALEDQEEQRRLRELTENLTKQVDQLAKAQRPSIADLPPMTPDFVVSRDGEVRPAPKSSRRSHEERAFPAATGTITVADEVFP